jgi:peroxiredoxin
VLGVVHTVILVARFALAAVFVVAAVGKLADRGGSQRAVEQFGVPGAVAGGVAFALPFAELAIAASLIFSDRAAWAAVGAAALLAVFCAAIVRSLARGATVDCHCFGSVASAPVGRATLARNAGLIVVAGFIAVAGWHDSGDSLATVIGSLGAATIVIAVAVVVQSAFSWQLFQQNGRLLQRVSKLEATVAGSPEDDDDRPLAAGDIAPTFELPDLQGVRHSLDELLSSGVGVLLAFTDPDCAHCNPLLPALGAPRSDTEPQVVVISRGSYAENDAGAQEHGIAPMLLQEDMEIAVAYRVFGFPAAIVIDSSGRIASPAAVGQQAVLGLLDGASEIRLPLTPAASYPSALAQAGPV